MPLEEFIIRVFCWVDEGVEAVTNGIELRTCGLAPRLSDSEVITMEIVGEMLGHDGDKAIWDYWPNVRSGFRIQVEGTARPVAG